MQTLTRPRSSATVAHARLVRLEAGRARIRSAGLREAAQLACTRAKDVCHRSDRAYADFASHLIALPSWPPDNGGALHRRLPAHVASVTLARHAVTRWLGRMGFGSGEVFDIGLALSEACANAVEHPLGLRHPAIEVRAERRGRDVWLFVRDFGHWRDRPPAKERGRGLGLMRSVMDTVEISRTGKGTYVVMRREFAWTQPG